MSPEFVAKWEHILEDVEKNKIPVQFIKKLVIKLEGKKQQTIPPVLGSILNNLSQFDSASDLLEALKEYSTLKQKNIFSEDKSLIDFIVDPDSIKNRNLHEIVSTARALSEINFDLSPGTPQENLVKFNGSSVVDTELTWMDQKIKSIIQNLHPKFFEKK